ncbi:MAG: hypothetical protein AAGD01_10940 [Acidobacteriota bacterium]
MNGFNEGRLSSAATTSWVSFLPGADGVGEQAGVGYFVQPERSVYYGGSLDDIGSLGNKSGSGDFATALGVNVSQLVDAEGEPAIFPLVPYAGVTVEERGGPINPGLGGVDFSLLESEVLSPKRQLLAPPNVHGPVFTDLSFSRDRGFAWGAGESKTAYGLTPQGLLAALNYETGLEGTWRELILAASSDGQGGLQNLSFLPPAGSEVLAPVLAKALMGNDLFLVLSLRQEVGGVSNVGEFRSEVTVDGFTFDLALAEPGDEIQAIVIFKFRSRALVDLAADVSTWTLPGEFNEFDGSGYPVQTKLQKLLDVPRQDPRFDHFRRMISDPEWNGILALNCALGRGALPMELQGLRGGMPGGLSGHHLGVEINRVDTGAEAQIEESSLFGFVTGAESRALADEDIDDFRFSVDRFYVSFLNSQIVDFVCDLTLTLDTLFSRPLKRGEPGEPLNELRLEGSFRRHENEQLFLFETDEVREFEIERPPETLRILTGLSVRRATFVTESAAIDEQAGETAIVARFRLEGGLSFAAGGEAESLPLDLFGFGGDHELPYRDLGLALRFGLTESGEVTGLTQTFDPGDLVFDA